MDTMLVAVVGLSFVAMLCYEVRKRFVAYRNTCQERLEIIEDLRLQRQMLWKQITELECNQFDNDRLTKDVQSLRNRLKDSSDDFVRVNNAKIIAEATLANLTKELEQRTAHVATLQEANRKAAVRITDLEAEIDDHNLPDKWQVARRPLSEELAEGRVATLSPTERVLQYEATQIPRDPNKAPAYEFSEWEGMVSGL